jgi:hypothetical protein
MVGKEVRVIVRSDGEMLTLMTQPDHAHLARRIMERCVPLLARPRREAILHAIGEHDNGWTEEDAAPVADAATGGVADFVGIVLDVRQRVWPRAVTRLSSDPWAAALVAQHAITIYDRFRTDAAWTAFFAQMESARGAMVEAAGLTVPDLLADYPFVRLGDLVSLVFCTGWTTDQRFGDWTVHGAGPHVVVTPGVFGREPIPVEIAAKQIRARPFQSDADLRAELVGASAITLRGTVADA